MPTFLYFGYGSNMLTARLRARCGSAKPVCVAHAAGYRLAFSKPSLDGSGKGHLVAAPKRARQPGVLFEIDLAERAALDRIEGPGYARRDDFPVQRADSRQTVLATVYLAVAPDPTCIPYDWYLALIVAGAREHRFDRRRIRQLLAAAPRPHLAPPWGGREEALSLLAATDVGADLAAYLAVQSETSRPLPRRKR